MLKDPRESSESWNKKAAIQKKKLKSLRESLNNLKTVIRILNNNRKHLKATETALKSLKQSQPNVAKSSKSSQIQKSQV